MNKKSLKIKNERKQKKIIKEWIELTLCELVDDILIAKNEREIKNILNGYATEIYLAQKYIEKK